jgi:hypothetical protein
MVTIQWTYICLTVIKRDWHGHNPMDLYLPHIYQKGLTWPQSNGLIFASHLLKGADMATIQWTYICLTFIKRGWHGHNPMDLYLPHSYQKGLTWPQSNGLIFASHLLKGADMVTIQWTYICLTFIKRGWHGHHPMDLYLPHIY